MHKLFERGERRHARDPYWGDDQRGRHRRGGQRHGGRRGRVLDQGDLRLIVLNLIAGAPRHGYEIIKQIEEATGGVYSPSPGVIYPTLTLLEEMGHAAVASTDGARKLYGITDDGRRHLESHRADLDSVRARIAKLGADRGASSPQIERAVKNLRTALHLRLERGIDETAGRAIADALDTAAKAIENN